MRNPPASPLIAKYSYYGPPVKPCGVPTIYFKDAFGNILDFLTAVYTDDNNGNGGGKNSDDTGRWGYFSIYLLDSTIAIKGFYEITAVFTDPGSYEFPLGLTLTVFDICDASYFDFVPVLSPNNQTY